MTGTRVQPQDHDPGMILAAFPQVDTYSEPGKRSEAAAPPAASARHAPIRRSNAVLFLRPTDSATIFLQQLGRGLRLADDKPCLTVLDFVGHQHKQFRFDRRYRALTGASRTGSHGRSSRGSRPCPPVA